MDLKEIEQWGRRLLEREAKKRGVRDPGAYTQAELIKLILRHDYSARNLRGTAKLVVDVLDGAKEVLRAPKQPSKRAFSWDRGTYERPQDVPFWNADEEPPTSVKGHTGVDLVAEANEREAERLRRAAQDGAAAAGRSTAEAEDAGPRAAHADQVAAVRPHAQASEVGQDSAAAARDGWQRATQDSDAAAAQSLADVDDGWQRAAASMQDYAPPDVRPEPPELRLVPRDERGDEAVAQQGPAEIDLLAASVGELADAEAEAFAEATALGYARDERASSEPEHVVMGPHPKNGLRLRWRVGEPGIARARAVLGTPGELALRVVAVRVDASAVVHTEITDHGPVDRDGVLIAPAPSDATRHITSIGLRNATRFVSIAHASD